MSGSRDNAAISDNAVSSASSTPSPGSGSHVARVGAAAALPAIVLRNKITNALAMTASKSTHDAVAAQCKYSLDNKLLTIVNSFYCS